MGSLVAQALALAYPERVDRLVLVASATTFDTPLVRELEPAVNALPDPVPHDFALEFQSSTVHRPIPDDVLRVFVSESLLVPARIWAAALAGQIAFHSGGWLDRLTAPTLIVWGDHDSVVSRAEQDRLHRGIRGSKLVCYEDTGHAVQWERPQRFADDVIAFVRS
jgi:pimeloyl-ACP methyl ester carboxylesterase